MVFRSSLNGVARMAGFCEGWPSPPTEAVLRRALLGSRALEAAIDGDRLVGFAAAIGDGFSTLFVTQVEVLPGYRGRGIGGELMRRMCDRLSEVRRVELHCGEGLVPFYQRLGFGAVPYIQMSWRGPIGDWPGPHDVTFGRSIAGVPRLDGFFEGWPEPPSEAEFRRVLSDNIVELATVGDELVGFACAASDGPIAALVTLLEVRREYRGRGIGSALMQRLAESCREARWLVLHCDSERASFYQRLGFARVPGVQMARLGSEAR